MTGQKWKSEFSGHLYAKQIKTLLDKPSPLLRFMQFTDGKTPPPSRWRRCMNMISWRVADLRVRLGEIIASRRFDDG